MILAEARFSLLPGLTVIGIVLGGTYALAAIGIVLIYRVSGVLNFAHGAVAMFSTFIAYQVSVVSGLPGWLGLLAAVAAGIAMGFIIERLTMRPLAGKPVLTKVVITIGWLIVLQAAAALIWKANAYHRAVKLVSKSGFRLTGTSVVVGYDQLTTLIVALVLALGTAAVLKYTMLGASMRAVADDPEAARLWGISVNRVTAASWMAGSAMAAIAGVLITPLITFDTFSLTLIVIDAFVAALIGRLTSLPYAVLGAFILGLVQEYPTAFTNNSGMHEVATFALLLIALAVLFRPGSRKLRVA
ncbi:MAG: branched-chain amino acid ABC transporter permease [Acidimicrobiia bacterium]|nr:branched-chain amino acid ABC transporter permease [Acidimicrobiia bacterium]MBV9040423.1 branched-chain amino acid ABC transporter permease [Acidimicrobiia bacterium]